MNSYNQMVEILRDYTGLSKKESKELLDNAIKQIKSYPDIHYADYILALDDLDLPHSYTNLLIKIVEG